MEIVLALVVGGLYSAGVYLILRRNLAKLIIGLIFLSNAANLLIFTAAGLKKGKPAFLGADGQAVEGMADPLPQALVLTAIVIGFGVLAFFIALIARAYQTLDCDDIDGLGKETR